MRYQIKPQVITITLEPGESIICQTGSVMQIPTNLSKTQEMGETGQFSPLSWVPMIIRRKLLGEGWLKQRITNHSQTSGVIDISAPYPGDIQAIRLGDMGRYCYTQHGAFVAAGSNAYMRIGGVYNPLWWVFSGEGLFLQRWIGDPNAVVFIHGFGRVSKRELKTGEEMQIRPGTFFAGNTRKLGVSFTGVRNALFGGQGVFWAKVKGPAIVLDQSITLQEYRDSLQDGSGRGRRSIIGRFVSGIFGNKHY